jgi:hypothetical protein
MASGDVDSELSITDRDRACLRFEGEEYLDQPRLGEDCERNLLQLCLEPKKYGAELFSSTLVGNLLAGYNSALARARQRDSRLRLRLRIEDKAAALHALRWEWLYDPHRSDALGASHEIALSRYMNLSEPSRPAITQKPRLLIALADPSDLAARGLPAMDREQTLEALKKTLVPLENQVEWEVLQGPVTPSALSVRLLEGEFHILHLQAHGLRSTSSACLVLEDEDGKNALVDEESLSQLFAGIRSLRLVTLISCHSAEQTQDDDPFSGLGQGLVRRGIPAVVAMRQAISFGAAARFCDRFYGNLARSGCVDAAVNEARNQLLISREKSEFGTPVVYTRLTNGLLWEVRQPEPKPKISSSDSKIDWEGLVDAVKKDDLLPFLGPGLWRGLLPSRSEIAKRWIGDYGEEFPTDVLTELSAVAQVLEARVAGRPREKLLRLLASELIQRQKQVEPDLERLCDSSLSEIVTYIASRHFARVPRSFSLENGVGRLKSLSGEAGYVTFFNPANLEVLLKMIDGRTLNQHFWLFYGSLSNVGYVITASDTETGEVSFYCNPTGTFRSIGDTLAFPPPEQ